MKQEALHEFYTVAVLPQFGLQVQHADWGSSEPIGPDEKIHFFKISEQSYALMFEDYDGLGRNSKYMAKALGMNEDDFEYVLPTSATNTSPIVCI